MKSTPGFISILLSAVVCAAPARAALKSGDPAPALRVGSWAQGAEVKAFEGDKVYIVEFWATWCGPCIASIPHVDELQKKYRDKGLVVIGQNLGEDAKTVSGFVKKMGSKMSYRVAVDDPAEGGRMAKYWLTAAEQNGIPCAFVVNKKGRIAYIGHPMELKESMLESLLAEPSTKPAEEPAAPAAPATPGAKADTLATRAANEIRAGKFDAAEATIGELQDVLAGNFGQIAGLLELDLLLAKKQPGDALELSKLLAEDYATNPAVLAAVASRLVSRPDATPALVAAAEKIASPLASQTGPVRASALSTSARAAFLGGDKARAIELQTEAVAASAKDALPAANAALEAYRQDRLPAAP